MSSAINEQTDLQLIKDILQEVAPAKSADFANLTTTTKISELGLDSISIMEMVGALEEHTGHTFNEAALQEVVALKDLIRLMHQE